MAEKSDQSFSDVYQKHGVKYQQHLDAAEWLEQEVAGLELLEGKLIGQIQDFRVERDRLGEYDASAAAIIKLAETVLALARLQRTAMRAHLATERARG